MKELKVFNQILQIRNFVKDCKKNNFTIGFVPTMGALHDGHLALIKNAQKICDIVVVSIFVNKMQFNDISDFENYPRNLDDDIALLESAQVDALFIPNHAEIYPDLPSFYIIPVNLVDCLCASNRKGHFDGVALVITKLFNIVNPDFSFFGEKDFQQLLVVKKLVEDLNFNTKIIAVPTLRESSGLAMSSRNKRLSYAGRNKAAVIFQILKDIKKNPLTIPLKIAELTASGFDKIDYLEIRNESDLNLNYDINSNQKRRIFIAVYLEGVRLIDNIQL